MKLFAQFILIILGATLVSCAVIKKPDQKTLNIRPIESLPMGASPREVTKWLGVPDRAYSIGEGELTWIYEIDIGGYKNLSRYQIEFVGFPMKMMAKSIDIYGGDRLIDIEISKRHFSNLKFTQIDEPWCDWSHSGPDRRVYVSPSAGLRISYMKARKEVSSITWVNKKFRNPTTVDDYYSCKKPRVVKVTKHDPKNLFEN